MPRATTKIQTTKPVVEEPSETVLEIRQLRKQTSLMTDIMLGLLIVLFAVVSSVFLPEVLFRTLYAQNPEGLNQELFALIPTISYAGAAVGAVFVVIRYVQSKLQK